MSLNLQRTAVGVLVIGVSMGVASCGASDEPPAATNSSTSSSTVASTSSATGPTSGPADATSSPTAAEPVLTFCSMAAEVVNTALGAPVNVAGSPVPDTRLTPGLKSRTACTWGKNPMYVNYGKRGFADEKAALSAFGAEGEAAPGLSPETRIGSTGIGHFATRRVGDAVYYAAYGWQGANLTKEQAATALDAILKRIPTG